MTDDTKNLRDSFIRAVRRRLRGIRGVVREQLGYETDLFGLSQDGSQPEPDGVARGEDDLQVFRFQSRRKNVVAFGRWFNTRLRQQFLEPIDSRDVKRGEHWTGSFIRSSFAQGWKQARNRLRQRGVSVGSIPGSDTDRGLITVLGNLPRSERALQEVYQRAYENLQSIEHEMTETVLETLLRGLDEGVHPREMANRLTKEIRRLQRTRAETLARTESVHAYTVATVKRYRQAGIDAVTQAEFTSVGDSRVCPVCSVLDGRPTPMSTIESATFRFEPGPEEPDSLAGEYRRMPPTHCSCRCVLLPVIE